VEVARLVLDDLEQDFREIEVHSHSTHRHRERDALVGWAP
jgi:hypothetical protein